MTPFGGGGLGGLGGWGGLVLRGMGGTFAAVWWGSR